MTRGTPDHSPFDSAPITKQDEQDADPIISQDKDWLDDAETGVAIEDVVSPEIAGEPDEDEAEEIRIDELEKHDLEIAIEQARGKSIDAIAKAGGISGRVKDDLPPRVQEALAREQAKFPDANLAELAKKAYSDKALPPSPTYKETRIYDEDAGERTARAVSSDLDEAMTESRKARTGANIELLRQREAVQSKQSMEQHAKASGVYDVKSARLQPVQAESFWGRVKRSWFGGTTEMIRASKKEGAISDSIVKKIDKYDEGHIRPSHDMHSTDIISARIDDLNRPKEKKPGFFGMLFGRKTEKSFETKLADSLKKYDRAPVYSRSTTLGDLQRFQDKTGARIRKQAEERRVREGSERKAA